MISLTSVTFRQLTLPQIFALAQENRIPALELGCDVHMKNMDDAYLAANLTKKTGVQVLSLGSYYRAGVHPRSEFDRLLPLCAITGAKNIRIWANEKGSAAASPEDWAATAADARYAAEKAAKQGVTVSFEFHQNTLNDNGQASRALLKAIDHASAKTYWQPLFRGQDTENLRAVLPLLSHVHVFYWQDYDHRFALADGAADWQSWLALLGGHGFSGAYIMEFVKDDAPAQWRQDLQTLREWLL